MNGFEFTLIYGVIVVFGILQIILFFKLWGMTNDVRHISEKIGAQPIDTFPQLEQSIRKLLLEGEKDQAIDLLRSNLVKDLIDYISKGYNYQIINNLKNNYREYYEKFGVPFPEQVEKINTLKDLEQLF